MISRILYLPHTPGNDYTGNAEKLPVEEVKEGMNS
jgi:hypothetical protein